MNIGMQDALATAIKKMLEVVTAVADEDEDPDRIKKMYKKCVRSIQYANFKQHENLIKKSKIDTIQGVQLAGQAALQAFYNFVDLIEDFDQME